MEADSAARPSNLHGLIFDPRESQIGTGDSGFGDGDGADLSRAYPVISYRSFAASRNSITAMSANRESSVLNNSSRF